VKGGERERKGSVREVSVDDTVVVEVVDSIEAGAGDGAVRYSKPL